MPKFKTVEELNNALTFDKLTPEVVENLKEGMGFAYMTAEEDVKIHSIYAAVNPGNLHEDFEAAGFHHQATNRQVIAFWTYIMAKKDMSFLEAINFAPGTAGFEDTLKEFHKFLKEHPVKNIPAEAKEKNVGEWTDIFMKAADKFSEYTFPDIDYTNSDEVREHSYEFDCLHSFEINYSQEFDRMLENGNKILAEKKAGSSAKLNESRAQVEGMQSVVSGLTEAYKPEKFGLNNGLPQSSINNWVNRNAQNRIKFGLGTGQVIGGKKASEIRKEAGIRNLYSDFTVAITPIKLKGSEGKDFFINGLNEADKAKYKKAIDDSEDQFRKSYNASFGYSAVLDFKDHIVAYGKKEIGWEWAFSYEDDPAELVSRINSDDGVEIRNSFREVFSSFLTLGSRAALWSQLGINSPINTIKIGGKTPGELWGDKVKDLKSDADKETYYMTMIMKESMYGSREVSADLYIIDEKYQLKKVDMPVIKSPAGMAKEYAFFKGVRDLHDRLQSYKDQLLATGDHSSTTFTNMMEALDECINSTRFTGIKHNEGVSAPNIIKNLQNLQKAGKAYHKSHTGIRGIFKAYSDEGKERVSVAENFKDNMVYEIERFKDLSSGMNLYLDEKTYDMSLLGIRQNIVSRWEGFKNTYNLRADLKKGDGSLSVTDENVTAENEAADKIVRDADKRVDLRKQLHSLNKLGSKLQSLEKGLGNGFNNPVEYAKKYIFKEYSKLISVAGTSPAYLTVDELEKEFSKDRFAKDYIKQVDELIRDEGFRKLVEEDPKHCVEKWAKKNKNIDKNNHLILSNTNDTYIRLKNENPKDFDKRWNTAKFRVESWAKDWAKMSEKKSIEVIKNDIKNLPTKDIEDDVIGMSFDDGKNAIISYDNKKNEMADKYSELLTQSILRDNYRKYGEDKIMDVAMDAGGVERMKNFIKEGLVKDDVFENKATAQKALSDIVGMKQKAIQYIREGEHQQQEPAPKKMVQQVKKQAGKAL